MGIDKSLLVEIAVKTENVYKLETGYGITRNPVLTAQHGLATQYNYGKSIIVRFVGTNEDWIDGEIIWESIKMDASLLQISQPREIQEPVQFGKCPSSYLFKWIGGGFHTFTKGFVS